MLHREPNQDILERDLMEFVEYLNRCKEDQTLKHGGEAMLKELTKELTYARVKRHGRAA